MKRKEDKTTVISKGRSSPADEVKVGGISAGGLLQTVLETDDAVHWETGFRLEDRFVIEKRIGKGGFSVVFRAYDENLRRLVAVKVILRGALDESESGLLEEGRALARLSHQGIVTVHDVGETDDGRVYYVSDYIEGETLARKIAKEKFTPEAAAEITAEIAEVLAYAHERSVIHRDIKPTNIVITKEGTPVLIDFGIAMAKGENQRFACGSIMGTPGYMSPEQARGEGHLVDGRSDVFSLGVILYEMLTGRCLFEGRPEDLIERTASAEEVRPPGQLDSSIPRAIGRICLKALAKRTSDRYENAGDLAEELRSFAESKVVGVRPGTTVLAGAHVVPKGLLSFDEGDAVFFLKLLPGLRDYAGVPAGIRFWLSGIENRTDPFRVGVLYGPSGSGKSSFLKAGLLPLLPDSIRVIYLAADAGTTESRLAERLRSTVPELKPKESLARCIRRIRVENPGGEEGKILIVIDQFEQWLHFRVRKGASELVSALRQCDGETVQVLLAVRDDFWLSVGQLMEDIDVDLLQSQNAAAIDLFDRDHSRKVLADFGRAHGRFPSDGIELSPEQSEFVESAIADMEEDGKVIPLRLALFAEMAKEMEWTAESYRKTGGPDAIGVEFLTSVFSSRTANPAHRAVEPHARAILEALLPEADANIRGRPLAEEELKAKSGLEEKPERFAATMRILDGELRLVTPADQGDDADPKEEAAGTYQLTHDYLVPSLRDWLYESRRRTMGGRLRIRLKELAAAWHQSRDRRNLPSFLEWIGVHALLRRVRKSRSERNLMAVANRRYGFRVTIVGSLGLVLGGFIGYRTSVHRIAENFLAAEWSEIPRLAHRSTPYRPVLERIFEEHLADGTLEPDEEAKVLLFLSENDPEQVSVLFQQLPTLTVDAFTVVVDELCRSGVNLERETESRLLRQGVPAPEKLRLAAFLAHQNPDHNLWRAKGNEVVDWLTAAPDAEIDDWCHQFSGVYPFLETHLKRRVADENASADDDETLSRKLILAMAEFSRDDPAELLDLYYRTNPDHLAFVLDRLEQHRETAGKDFGAALLLDSGAGVKPVEKRNPISEKQARAGAALFRFEDYGAVRSARLLQHRGEMTRRNLLVHYLAPAGVDPRTIFNFLENESGFNGNTPVQRRRTLILALGEYRPNLLPAGVRGELVEWLRETWKTDSDPGVHSAARWVLQEWGEPIPELPPGTIRIGRPQSQTCGWMIDSQGGIYSVTRSYKRYLAAGVSEVTIGQIDRAGLFTGAGSVDRRLPAGNLTLRDAGRFCNWLSGAEGIPASEWCYDPESFEPVDDYQHRTGFRLPSVVEWKIIALSGTVTRRAEGESDRLIGEYSWFARNSPNGVVQLPGLLKPNDYGLFDVMGNAAELCHPDEFENDRSTGFLCGGSACSEPVDLDQEFSLPVFRGEADPNGGFRVVRTLSPEMVVGER